MGKKSAPPAPTPPDPREIAQTDAEFNRINQVTPYGNLTYSGPNRNTATLTLPPELQQLIDSRTQLDQGVLDQGMSRLAGLDQGQIDLSQFGPVQSDIDLSGINFEGVDLSGLGPLPNAPDLQTALSGLQAIPGNIDQFRGDVEDAYYDRTTRLLRPEFQRQEDRLRQTLANQGLPSTDEAFQEQAEIFGENRNRAYGDIADQAVLRGGQEASRQLANILAARQQGLGEMGAGNQAMLQELAAKLGIRGQQAQELFQGAGFNNQVAGQRLGLQQQLLGNRNAGRLQGLNEALATRGTQVNEMAQLLGLQQVAPSQLNNFFAPSQVDTGLGFQLQNQQQNANYQAQLAQQQAAMGGLFGIGSALIGGAGAAGGFSNLFS